MAPQRRARQPHGEASGGRNPAHPPGQNCLERRGERRIRTGAKACHRKDQTAVLLLYVDGGGVDRALDVLVRYHRRRRAQVRAGGGRSREITPRSRIKCARPKLVRRLSAGWHWLSLKPRECGVIPKPRFFTSGARYLPH